VTRPRTPQPVSSIAEVPATSLSTKDSVGALRILRAAQSDLAALAGDHQLAARQAVAKSGGVGSGSAVPPAEQSSTRLEMMKHVSGRNQALVRNVTVARLIDAIRRHISFQTIFANTPGARARR
jgi:hypothetical protein